MSQFDDDDQIDLDTATMNEVRNALKKANKRATTAEAELAGYRNDSRKRELQGAIETRGLDPVLADLVPDGLDSTALGSWLDKYGPAFAPKGAVAPPVVDETETAPVATEAEQTFAAVTGGGTAPVNNEATLIARLNAAKTVEEYDEIMDSQR